MDIWAWVEARHEDLREHGHDRLADVIQAVPSAVVGDDVHGVETMVPEGLALARGLNDDWVEIYLRHWQRQLRGGGRAEVPDAVELFELAHRDKNADCPQSVCVVQDLAIAYEAADGLGYAADRLDISAETLDRIDASW